MPRPKLSFFLAVSAALLAGGLVSPLAHAQEVLSGIAAVVNKDVITFDQVRELVGAQERAARGQLTGTQLVEKVKEMRLAALNELINRQLILQEFGEIKKKGGSIPPHVVDEHIQAIIRERFGGDRSAFVRTLAAQNLSMERFRQMEEEKIIVGAMKGQHVQNNVIVPDAQIRDYYQKHLLDWTSDAKMHLRMMSMRKSGGTDDNRKKMMQEIRQKIASGVAFADLARMYNEDEAHQDSGGDWGWVDRRMLNETLSKAAFSLKPGEISPIMELSGNYYLLYCEAKQTSTTKPFAEVRSEIEKQLMQQERQKVQEEWMAKLRKKAFVKIY